MPPLFSVVVCTRNRSHLLSCVLSDLAGQDTDLGFEVIVVDNGSNDDTRSLCENYASNNPRFKYYFEQKLGLSHARNRGWREAQGNYVAYADDDCRVPTTWLGTAGDIARGVAPEMFGGPFYGYFLSRRPCWYRNCYGSRVQAEKAGPLTDDALSGGNMFVKRSVLEELGGFRPQYGMSGDQLGYAEEDDLQMRLRAAKPSSCIYYDPRLYVHHLVPARKMKLVWICRQRFALGKANAQLEGLSTPSTASRARLLRASSLRLASTSFRMGKWILRGDRTRFPTFQNYFYEDASALFFTLGRMLQGLRADLKRSDTTTGGTGQMAGSPMPLVSVIVPTFNRRALVGQAVDSILDQTYQNLELLVIDDGSTDGTGEFLKSAYGDRLTYYFLENRGPSSARNYGAQLARGKYLAFLDSDDCWLPEKLERQVAALESRKSKHACAVCSSGLLIDRDGNTTSRRPEGRHVGIRNYSLENFIRGTTILCPLSNMLVKKACFDEVGGLDSTIRVGEDWDLVVRLRAKWGLLYLDTPLFRYRVHVTPSQSPGDERAIRAALADCLRVARKSAHFIPDPGRRTKVVRETESRHYKQAAYRCFWRADWDAGVNFLVRAGELGSGESPASLVIARLVGHWGARSAVERISPSSEAMRRYFRDECLRNVLPRIPERVAVNRELLREAWGVFFFDLASDLLPLQNWKLIRTCYQRAFSFRPRYLLSVSTLTRYLSTFLKESSPASELTSTL